MLIHSDEWEWGMKTRMAPETVNDDHFYILEASFRK